MLKFTHEHWKKKAEEEYYAAVTKQEKIKSEDKHMFDWNRRYREGKWLLKGVTKVEDAQMNTILEEKAARDKQNKYIPEEEEKKKKKAKEQGVGTAAVPAPKINYYQAVVHWLRPPEKKVNRRVRNAQFVIKEGIAKVLVQRDVQNERDAFLQRNSLHIRVLQNVCLGLHKPRLPAHHADTSFMGGAEPPMSAEVAAEIGARNLRTYTLPEPQRIVETLRSVDEVKEEEMARRRHWVPGRYHQYLGLHRIFPLRFAPATHEVIHGQHALKESYPEDALLPDYSGRQRKKEEDKRHRNWVNGRIVKVKKVKLDMSRRQFRFHAPIAPDLGQAADGRRSEQFHWATRNLEDRNSVYLHPHGEVAFTHGPPVSVLNTNNQLDDALSYQDLASVHDDSTVDTSVKYHFISDSSVSQHAHGTSGHTVAATLTTVADMPSDICHTDQYASDNALRSNCFSAGSTRTNQLVPVRLERHRRLKGLRGKHIKGLALESRRTQLARRSEQQLQKFVRPHTAS